MKIAVMGKRSSDSKGRRIIRFLKDESGMGTVEMILIIVVLIGLVIIFKSNITKLASSIFDTITEKASVVTG
ncbi:MAG: hypothetical protein J6P87_10120 [Lachnospiraceae bacterium]|nr:hypothetical protein [Lachnospiraceae bacterium]